MAGKNGIELAIEKSKLIVLTRKRTHNTLQISIKGLNITSTASVKYLEVHLDQLLNFKAHAAAITEKADKATRSIRGIMPNLGGPRHGTRMLLAAVPLSILLYGAPI